MHNVLKIPQVSKIVQLGIRDFCKEEYVLLSNKKERIKTFSDKYLKEKQFNGIAWSVTCAEIISNLSGNIYISFDIDGLQPHLCPNTQSPVPGGMAFDEICYLISQFSKIGKKIIGFDLCNVTPGRDKDNDWDANVGARILYELSCMTLLTNT